MSKQEKSRKPLIIGIVAAVVILAALLGLLLTQCVGGGEATQSTPAQTVGNLGEAEHYDLYWNLDRALYDGKSEAGMSSRKPESDGFFHVRFFKDGETIELKVADRKTVNAIEVNDLMGLEFDSNGVVVGVISLDDMPLQQVGWKFYVQSIGGNLLKLNSAKTFDGMELLCEMLDDTGLYDMTGVEGEVGKRITPIATDRVIAIANLAGELTHVFIYERSEYMQTFQAECQHCKETVTWKVWNKPNTLPVDTGHYQLSDNIVLKKQQAILEDGKVCLDLNGYVVDGADNARVYTLHNVGANLALMDTSEGKTGVLRGHSTSSPQGGVVWVRYGAFYMYGGTLDGSDMTSVLNGTVVQVPKGCYFYMFDGTIIGGTSKYTYNEETNKYSNGLGGAVSVSGKFVMHDGEIRDGRAQAAISAWNADGTPKTYQRGIGGNVYVASGAEFEMKGGTIKNGVADHSGGNVYLDGTATMIMDGGTIAGGTVTGKGRNGGNVFVTTKATFTMNGGSVNWGVSHNCAGNLYFNGTVNMNGGYIGCGVIRDWATGKVKPTDSRTNVFQVGGSMTMFGGVIDGGYTITDTSATDKTYTTLILGGMPVISGREELEYDDLVLTNGGSGVNVIVATMIPGSKVGVNATTGIFTKPTAEANKQYFYSNIDEANVEYVDGCIALGRWSCLCGSQEHFGKCDGTQLFWIPVPAPVNKTLPSAEGNYYLVKDITITTQGQVAENAHVNLDLYGHTLTGPNNHRTIGTFNPGSSLAITDTSEAKTGAIKTRGAGPTQGSAVWVRYGTFDLYGGTLDGSDYTLYANWNYGTDKIYGTKDDKTEGRDGGTVSMGTATTFNMYGGTIIGAKAILYTAEKTVTEGEGENAVKKTVTRELISANGGALGITKNAVFNMYDGVIRDGHTDGKGGNIYMAGDGSTANLYGGIIENGDAGMRDENDKLVTYVGSDGKTKTKSAGWGANIDMNDKSTVNLLGTIVMGGRSGGNGGNIRVGDAKATLNMSAGMVCDGQSTNDQGGNIFISGTANLTGGVVENGQARNGGNIGVNSSKVATLNGTVVRGGVASGNGGNIRMSSTNKGGALVIAEGAVITGGKAYRGGNLCVELNNANKNDPESVLKITGGTIEKGLADGEFGGNIYMASGAVMEMTGGLVDGGKAVNTGSGSYGGNLYNNGATVTISGGVLQNGQSGVMAEDGETVVFGNNDSTKKGWGGNISMKAGTLTISGDAQILGGTAGRNGGSIHAEGGTLNVAGGTISGGVSTADQGGNIWAGGSKTYLNITGGTIKDGTTAKNGGNIHCNADTNVSLTGGYITGGSAYGSKTYKNANVNLYASKNITIGSVKIDGYVLIASSVKLVDKPVIKGGVTNLSLNGFDVDVSGLDVGSDVHMIGVTDSGAGIFSGEADKGEEAYFFSDDAEKVVGFANGKLTLDKGRLGMGRYRCLCGKTTGYEGEHAPGCDKDTTRFWAAWTSTNSLPTEHGNWYLTADSIEFTTQFAMEEGAEIAIDLNGCIVTDKDNRMLTTSKNNKSGNVTLWITDTSAEQTGTLKLVDSQYDGPGMILWLDTNSTLNFIAGTIDVSETTNLGDVRDAYGNAVYMANKSTFNMYGGTILGGTAVKGGAVYVGEGTTFNMTGGKIEGGTAMFASTTSEAKDKDGNPYTVYNYDSGKGGAVFVDGTMNMSGGEITGGKAILGQVQNGVNDKDEPTYINDGGHGGNVYVVGTMNFSGGTITLGKAGRLTGEGEMDYGTDNSSKAGWGGNIAVRGGTLNITGGEITDGKSGGNGGNVYIYSGTALMEGGTVSGGKTVVDQGGNIFTSGTLTITGGTVKDGVAANGGNIGINTSETTTIGGNAVISGGTARGDGGNIRMNSTQPEGCQLKIEGNAQITGGTAKNGGNIGLNLIAADDSGSLVMTGGTVSGGKALYNGGGAYGGNIYSVGADITITGGTVENGLACKIVENEGVKSNVYKENGSTRGWGGNICMDNKSTNRGVLTVGDDAQITGGISGGNGGSIYNKGDIIVSGGTISGGETKEDNGGNIWLASGATLEMTNGNVFNGMAKKNGGNIHSNAGNTISFTGGHIYGGKVNGNTQNVSANINIAAGEGTITLGSVQVDGYVKIGDGNTVTLTGAPKINGAASGKTNLSIGSNMLTLGELTEGANVGITKTGVGVFSVANTNAETYKAYFTSDNADYSVGAVDNCLVLGKSYCLCGDADGHEDTSATTGCNGQVRFWQAWTSDNSLPTKTGNYYLTSEEITFKAQYVLEKDSQIAIDLNGCVVTDTDNRMLTSSTANGTGNVTLWITDTAEGGKLVVTDGSYKDKAVVMWLDTNSTLNLIAGTLDAQAVNATTGGAILVAGNSTLKMYGGKIIGGNATTGGAVQVNGGSTFEMYGGIIEGGKASTSGDALYVDGNLKLFGGTINGEVDATKADTITVSGNIKLDAAETNLNLGENTLTVGELTSGASIGITADEGAFTAAGCTEADLAYFSSDVADMGVTYYNGQLHMGKLACLCGSPSANAADHKHSMDGDTLVGCDGTKVAWTPWTSTTTLPTTTGYYYLTAPVVVTVQQGFADVGQHVALDLNGYQVSVNSKNNVRIYAVNKDDSSLVITDNYVVPAEDSADYDANRTGGKLLRSSGYTGEGGVVWLSNASQKLVLIRGEMTAPADSKATGTGGLVSCNGDFYMLGGYLHDGKTSGNGGNVCMKSTSTMYLIDGRILNGSANNGGNLDINDGATLVMVGGTVSGGKSGNTDEAKRSADTVHADVQGRGTLIINGGTIAGNVNVFNWQRVSGASITLSGTAQVGRIHLNKGSASENVKVEDIQIPTITINGALSNTTPILVTTYGTVDHYFATTTEEANAERFTTNYEGKAIHYIDGKLYLGKYNCLCGGNGNTDTANGGTCVGATEGCDSVLRVWTATASLPSTSGNYYLPKDVTLTTNGPTITAASDIALDLNGYNITMQMTGTCGGRLYSTNGSGANAISFLFTNTYGGTDAARTGKIIFDDTKVTTDPGGDQGRVVWFTGSGKSVKVYNVGIDMTKATVRKGVKQNGMVFGAYSDNAAARASLELYNVSIVGGTARSSLIGVSANADALFHDVSITGHTGAEDYSGLNISDITANAVFSGNTYVTGNKLSDGTTASNIRLANGGVLHLAEDYTGTAGQVSGITAQLGAENAPRDVVFGTDLTYAVKDLFKTDDDKVLGFADGKLTVYAAGSHVHCVCAGNLGTKANGYVCDLPGTENDHVCEDILYTPISGELAGGAVKEGGNWYLQDDVTIKSGNHYQMIGVSINLCMNGKNWTGAKDKRPMALQPTTDGVNYLSVTTCQADVLDKDGIPTNNRIVSNGSGAQGFGVWVSNGTFDFYAGCIDGRNFKSSSNGAIVNVGKNQFMNMYSSKCTILGGTNAASQNGATMGSYGTTNMYNGTIKNGTSSHYAGNLHISSGVFTMYDGLITGGNTTDPAKKWSANGAMAGGTFNMLGGQIDGGFGQLGDADSNNSNFVISGDAVIDGGTSGYNLRDTSRLYITVKDLKDTAKIVLDLTSSQTIKVEGALPENWDKIITANGYTATLNAEKTEITFTENP